MSEPILIGDAVDDVIGDVADQIDFDAVCPCCGSTWADLLDAGELEIVPVSLSRQQRRFLQRRAQKEARVHARRFA